MNSSYMENNYGNILRTIVLTTKPKLAVECGLLEGYSTFHIAHAIRFNKVKCDFWAYDLFEDYQYKHSNYEEVKTMLKKQNLYEYVNLEKGNAFEVYKYFKDGSVDFLHVDISNDGDKLLSTLKLWGSKLSENGMIAFEGGNQVRDEGWIKKYGHKPIIHELMNNEYIHNNWKFQILYPFPGMTLLWKK